jgi:hypothetical protein
MNRSRRIDLEQARPIPPTIKEKLAKTLAFGYAKT